MVEARVVSALCPKSLPEPRLGGIIDMGAKHLRQSANKALCVLHASKALIPASGRAQFSGTPDRDTGRSSLIFPLFALNPEIAAYS